MMRRLPNNAGNWQGIENERALDPLTRKISVMQICQYLPKEQHEVIEHWRNCGLLGAELTQTQAVFQVAGGTIIQPIFSFPGGRRFAVWSGDSRTRRRNACLR